MPKIKLKTLLQEVLLEMPRICQDLTPSNIDALSNMLNVRLQNNKLNTYQIDGGYFIVFGELGDICDRWAAIISKKDDDLICHIGATFHKKRWLKGSYQSKLINKMQDNPSRAASTLYIELARIWNCPILSDNRQSVMGSKIWLSMWKNRVELANDGVILFILNTATLKEVPPTDNIEHLFANSDVAGDVVIGLRTNQ